MLRQILRTFREAPGPISLDLLADPDDPRDLFGMLLRRQAAATAGEAE